MSTYTTSGSVRGDCGHQHRTIGAAVRCIDTDDRGCKRSCGQDAYSDRRVIQGDGELLATADYEDIASGAYDAR